VPFLLRAFNYRHNIKHRLIADRASPLAVPLPPGLHHREKQAEIPDPRWILAEQDVLDHCQKQKMWNDCMMLRDRQSVMAHFFFLIPVYQRFIRHSHFLSAISLFPILHHLWSDPSPLPQENSTFNIDFLRAKPRIFLTIFVDHPSARHLYRPRRSRSLLHSTLSLVSFCQQKYRKAG
jgi:hypothetical protein